MWYEVKHKQQKMPKAWANINVDSSTRFSGLIFEDEIIWYHELPGMWWELKHKQQKMPQTRANMNVYSSTWFSSLIFEDKMRCIQRTARYVVRNQAETAEDAESTSKHERIQQYAIFRFNFWRWNDMHTTNCKVCGTKSSRNSRRCRKHEWSTYTEVRDFPVWFLKTKWYVYLELRGMWWELKHKQQKMPKARANMNVYSSTRFSGLIFEDEMICIARTARYVCGTKSSRSIRCRKYERLSTYTAVRDFPV